MKKSLNLNDLEPEDDAYGTGKNIQDNSVLSGSVQVYFRDLTKHLITHISSAEVVVGCVAWLTHPEILAALKAKSVSLVVQKEDFLRPDFGAASGWKRQLRAQYDALKCHLTRYDFNNMIGSLSTSGDPSMEPVRCVGNYNREKAPAFPRMHNKFLVFCRTNEQDGLAIVTPYAVWTGSFNLTYNAENSLENAVYITEASVVKAYFQEFGQVMALSESLDWESEWSVPEWRIGT